MNSLLTIAGLLLSGHVFAGDKIGNGGDAIVCRNSSGQIISAELLDYYEAREIRKINIETGPAGDSVENKINLVLARLKHFDNSRVQRYKKYLDLFTAESKILNADLVDIPDSEHVSTPKNCHIEQAAIFKEPDISSDPKYFISKEIWTHLDTTNRAGLILHEVIYRTFREDGSVNSVKARYFHSMLASKDIESWEIGHYVSLLKQLQMNFDEDKMEYLGYRFFISSLDFFPNGKIKGGPVSQDIWERPDGGLGNYVLRFDHKNPFSALPSAIYFDEYGNIVEINYIHNKYFFGIIGLEVTKDGYKVSCNYLKGSLTFYGPSFNLRSCYSLPHGKYLPPVPFPQEEDVKSTYIVQGKVIFLDEDIVEFFENGAIKRGNLKIETELKNQKGQTKMLKGKLMFDKDGLVIE